jgi:OOP family OmpA-OmpF porin
LGGSYGPTWFETDIDNLTGAAKLDEASSGYKVFGGFNFNKYRGVEGFYAYFGETSLSGNTGDTFSSNGSTLVFLQDATVTSTAASYGLAAVAGIDLGIWRPIAKTGFHRWSTETTAASATSNASADNSGFGYLLGLGLLVHLSDRFSLRTEYEYFSGDDNESVGLLSFGAQVNF